MRQATPKEFSMGPDVLSAATSTLTSAVFGACLGLRRTLVLSFCMTTWYELFVYSLFTSWSSRSGQPLFAFVKSSRNATVLKAGAAVAAAVGSAVAAVGSGRALICVEVASTALLPLGPVEAIMPNEPDGRSPS